MWEKLKSFLADDTTFYALLLLLVGLGSFGLGRLSIDENQVSRVQNQPAGVILHDVESKLELEPLTEPQNRVVVSKSGTKYHLLDCPGAAQIREENKIYFDSPDMARAAGYSPAANCSGLK